LVFGEIKPELKNKIAPKKYTNIKVRSVRFGYLEAIIQLIRAGRSATKTKFLKRKIRRRKRAIIKILFIVV
jgi:hypothetical protein